MDIFAYFFSVNDFKTFKNPQLCSNEALWHWRSVSNSISVERITVPSIKGRVSWVCDYDIVEDDILHRVCAIRDEHSWVVSRVNDGDILEENVLPRLVTGHDALCIIVLGPGQGARLPRLLCWSNPDRVLLGFIHGDVFKDDVTDGRHIHTCRAIVTPTGLHVDPFECAVHEAIAECHVTYDGTANTTDDEP